ncbi:hypothetical protein JTB14_009749 [Gonioctena quinquepunctata]|nr:hypothetical protein JTB14_009749 [Gonioctena quinquepunctata]
MSIPIGSRPTVGFYNNVLSEIDERRSSIGIFCDLSRAFHCVPHNSLLQKICLHGLRGIAADHISLTEHSLYKYAPKKLMGLSASTAQIPPYWNWGYHRALN